MADKPEALRLATWLDHVDLAPMDYEDAEKAAAELRRLHAVNAELLETLRTAADHLEGMPDPEDVAACVAKARAAIAKAEGQA